MSGRPPLTTALRAQGQSHLDGLATVGSDRGSNTMALSIDGYHALLQTRLHQAAGGDTDACYDLGIAYSSGSGGTPIDLIEAHKWFNLAALAGSEAGQAARADIADDMTAREIAQAQRQARDWLSLTRARAA